MSKVLKVPFAAESTIWLAHKGGVSVEEIAAAYGITENVVRVMLRRFRRKLIKIQLQSSGSEPA
jgi:transposase